MIKSSKQIKLIVFKLKIELVVHRNQRVSETVWREIVEPHKRKHAIRNNPSNT